MLSNLLFKPLDGGVVHVPALSGAEVLSSISDLVKLRQVAFDSLPLQPCVVCHGASRGNIGSAN